MTVTDSRSIAATQPVLFTVASRPVISTAALAQGGKGTAYSQAFSVTGGVAPFTWSSTSQVPGLALNATTGVLSGTPTTVATTAYAVKVVDANGAGATYSASLIINQYFATTAANTQYSFSVPAYGTKPTWTITSGSLPAGFVLNPTTGVISGKGTKTGTFSFTVACADAATKKTQNMAYVMVVK
jgi:hypothetical protein